LIDPDGRSAEVFAGEGADGRGLGPEDHLEAVALPGLSLSLAALFAVLESPP